MPLIDKILRFEYEDALADLGIRSRTQLLSQLQAAARQRTDSAEAQMVHDVNWVLTQLTDEQRQYLSQLSRAVADTLADTYGPHASEFLSEFGITIESFVAPLSKTLQTDGTDPSLQLLKAIGKEPPRMPHSFAALFAGWAVWKQVVEKLNSREVPVRFQGKRFRFGYLKQTCTVCQDKHVIEHKYQTELERRRCQRCGGTGIDETKIQAALLLSTTKNAKDLARQYFSGEGVDSRKLLNEFQNRVACQQCHGQQPKMDELNDDIYCPDCWRWVDVPKNARTNWICPILDGHGKRKGWAKITLQN